MKAFDAAGGFQLFRELLQRFGICVKEQIGVRVIVLRDRAGLCDEQIIRAISGKLAGTPPLSKGRLGALCGAIGMGVAAVIMVLGGALF